MSSTCRPLVVLAVVSALLVGCGGGDDSASTPSPTPPPTPTPGETVRELLADAHTDITTVANAAAEKGDTDRLQAAWGIEGLRDYVLEAYYEALRRHEGPSTRSCRRPLMVSRAWSPTSRNSRTTR